MKRFSFYFKYAWRSIRRGGQLSVFAVICVSVGVATLVALQSLTISIRDTLVGDTQTRAGGDIVAGVNFNSYYQETVSPKAQQLLDRFKAEGRLADWTGLNNHSIQITGYFNVPPTVYIVDPAHYPLYGQVNLLEPSQAQFSSLLAEPNTIIVSKSLWKANNYHLGQQIEVSGLTDFTKPGENSASLKIVGVIDPVLPGINFDPGLFVGFGVVSQATARTFLETAETVPTTFLLKTTQASNVPALIAELQGFNGAVAASFPFFSRIRPAAEVLGENRRNLQTVEDILLYVGLLAILIGGLGCVNTMLVLVGRRTNEIGTLKALGLKNRQAVAIFTLEVTMLGALGSGLGLVLSLILGYGMKGVVEGLFGHALAWGLYPGPLLSGLAVGIGVSAMFGFLPAWAAGRVPPAVVLRSQQTTGLPRIGNRPTLLVILTLTLIMGLVSGLEIGNPGLGIVIAFVVLLVTLVLVVLMYGLVALVARLPAPERRPGFKMALRNFSRHRTRSATTLLVVTVSLFFISLITIVSGSIKTTLRETFDFNLGFNAGAVNAYSNQDLELQATLQREVAGLQKIFISNDVGAFLFGVNGQPLNSEAAFKDPACGPYIVFDRNGKYRLKGSIQVSGRSLSGGTESISPNGPQKLLAGRNLLPSDSTRNVLLVAQEEARCYGLKVGDKVNTRLRSNNLGNGSSRTSGTIELEVIGIVTRGTAGTNFEQGFVTPFQLVNEAGAQFSIFFMQIDPPQIKAALTKIQGYLYGNFVFDLSDLINTFTALIDQVLAFPLLLSLLSLFSGSILVANNVALAVLERRNEIGVLKALGARRRRVLAILLWESSLVGIIGGVLGIGGSVLVASLLPALIRSANANLNLLINWSVWDAALILALGIGLALAATLISAWRSVQEKPLTVLRYE